jgi:multiple RNA-binding domain-containing protein 1
MAPLDVQACAWNGSQRPVHVAFILTDRRPWVQVLAATRDELIAAGVNFEALATAAAASKHAAAAAAGATEAADVPRSATALIVKNLPYDADEAELRDLFSGFGAGAARVVLPSTRVFAIVEMASQRDARAAFRGLAYRRYHSVPLYLEFAPRDAVARAPVDTPATLRTLNSAAGKGEDGAQQSARAEGSGAAEDADTTTTSSLFVKNVAFATAEDALRKHFAAAALAAGGRLRSARLATAAKGDGRVVSRGYAFAEFNDAATARAVLARLQGAMLDGHALELQLAADKGADAAAATARAKKVRPAISLLCQWVVTQPNIPSEPSQAPFVVLIQESRA